jgi:hypothetical protein
MHSVISLETIKREAEAAAKQHSDINAACPYPFGSDAAHAFKFAFKEAREAITSKP